jgi:hypothetical protein
MIILSQNTLLAVRRAVLLNNDPDCESLSLWEASESVLYSHETLTNCIEEYLKTGSSWSAVNDAKASLAASVSRFEIKEAGERVLRRVDQKFSVARAATGYYDHLAEDPVCLPEDRASVHALLPADDVRTVRKYVNLVAGEWDFMDSHGDLFQ